MMFSSLTRHDFSFWVLSAVLGLIAFKLPWVLDLPSQGVEVRFASSVTGVTLSTAFLGYLRPRKPWRWGLGAMLLVPMAHLLVSASLSFAVLALFFSLPSLGLLLAVAMAGAHLGAGARARASSA